MTGGGTINGHGDQASFSIQVTRNAKGKITGPFVFKDPAAANLIISASTFSSLSFTGNSARFTGTAKVKTKTITFTVNVTDNGPTGTNDTFSVTLSNGYSAGGTLISGNITLR